MHLRHWEYCRRGKHEMCEARAVKWSRHNDNCCAVHLFDCVDNTSWCMRQVYLEPDLAPRAVRSTDLSK